MDLSIQCFEDQKGSPAEAAAFFSEAQPRIRNLLKGEISRFSVDKLMTRGD